MDIAHLIPYTGTALGGPVNGMAACVGLLADAGYSVTVYSASKAADGQSVRMDARVRHVQEPPRRPGGFRHSVALWRQVQRAKIDLVHSHGLWTDVSRLAGVIARRRGLPHVLAPCGMLAPGALRRHWWKKVPVRFWFQDRVLREAQCLHAKSSRECEDIRRFGLRNPVAVIPNPISLPPEADSMSKEDFRRSHQIPDNRKIVLFLGRLHPVKGLPRLLRAWARIRSEKAENGDQKSARKTEDGGRRSEGAGQWSAVSGQWPVDGGQEQGASSKEEWLLVLAGPDEGGHRRELESLVVELGCQRSVAFVGELSDQQKWGALAAAELFAMPSDFENFGNAIVEAMSCAIPVITTTGTPWEELTTTGAGWWVEPAVEELTGALGEALAMSDDQRRAMGRRALQLAERFRPGQVGEDLIAVYEWLLGTGPKPGCVV